MMTFEDLKEMLEEFENYLPEEEKEMAQVIQAEIESNGQYSGYVWMFNNKNFNVFLEDMLSNDQLFLMSHLDYR